MARTKEDKLDALGRQMKNGTAFKADLPHEAFARASLYRRRVTQYFEYCDMHKEHYSLPGLCLFLGLRSRALMGYDPGEEYEEYRRITDFAVQKIEAHIAQQFFTTKGSTKGIEFLAQNTMGYANKSQVDSKQAVEITEREKLKSIPDSELKGRIVRLIPKLQGVADDVAAKAAGV